jgi:hypothetical protein
MAARTAKPVVKVEMAKRRVEVVAPHQDYDPATKPDAFRISSGAADGLLRLDEFVGFTLIVFGRIGRRGGICSRRLARLVLGPEVTALGNRASNTDQQCKPGNGEVAQDRILKLKHPSTHKFPDLFPARYQHGRAGLMPLK